MKCKSPFFVKKYKILVACGKCMFCRVRRRNQWTARLVMEFASHSSASFLTLTYSDDHLPDPPYVSKRELQLFFKRLRKALGDHPIRYFACGEYGEGRGRPHYHAIVYGLEAQHFELVSKAWPFGFVHFGDFSYRSAAYVAGYTTKKITNFKEDRPKEFVLMSRRPALGSCMLEDLKHLAFLQNPYDVLSVLRIGGRNFPLDRTIREKLRKLVMSDFDINRVKKLIICNLRDELETLIKQEEGYDALYNFRVDSGGFHSADILGQVYHKKYFNDLNEREKWISRRQFRKDL